MVGHWWQFGIRMFILQNAAFPHVVASRCTSTWLGMSCSALGRWQYNRLLFAFPMAEGVHSSASDTLRKNLKLFSRGEARTCAALSHSSDSIRNNPDDSDATSRPANSTRLPGKSQPPVGALAWQRPGQPLTREGSGRRRSFRSSAPSNTPGGNSTSEQGTIRSAVPVGTRVAVVKKEDQRTGVTTEGTVMRLLTKSPFHPRGIKVAPLYHCCLLETADARLHAGDAVFRRGGPCCDHPPMNSSPVSVASCFQGVGIS